MRNGYERGDFIEWLLMLLAISVVIFAILIPKTGREFSFGLPEIGGNWYTEEGTSAFSGGIISIGPGNARFVSDPMSEYITLSNNGSRAINITGWRLENGKSARTYTLGGQNTQYTSDTAIIPQGARILSPIGRSTLSNIILNPGERAVIYSGGPGNIAPTTIVSFKENICTGYLDKDYDFSSGIEKSCVRPADEPGLSSLDTQCRDFVRNMQSCHAPKIGGVNFLGQRCENCVDGRENLSSQCISYIKTHFSYAGCVANHVGDTNFEGRTWHIYLHRPWEMWASSYESISLYDSSGNLVNSYSY